MTHDSLQTSSEGPFMYHEEPNKVRMIPKHANIIICQHSHDKLIIFLVAMHFGLWDVSLE